jgi:hypothetical protein
MLEESRSVSGRDVAQLAGVWGEGEETVDRGSRSGVESKITCNTTGY